MRSVTINGTTSVCIGSDAGPANYCLARLYRWSYGNAASADNTHDKLARRCSSSPARGRNGAGERTIVACNIRRLESATRQARHRSAATYVEVNPTDILDNTEDLIIAQEVCNGDGHRSGSGRNGSGYILIITGTRSTRCEREIIGSGN